MPKEGPSAPAGEFKSGLSICTHAACDRASVVTVGALSWCFEHRPGEIGDLRNIRGSMKDYAKRVHQLVSAMLDRRDSNPGDGSWGDKAIDALHGEFGCGKGCREKHGDTYAEYRQKRKAGGA